MASESPARSYAAALATLVVVTLAGLGYLAFLAFVKGILVPGEFAGYGLAITAVAAGTASFFSPFLLRSNPADELTKVDHQRLVSAGPVRPPLQQAAPPALEQPMHSVEQTRLSTGR